MKIRLGYVSNSSTTSFCIYGYDFYDYVDKLKEKYGDMDGYELLGKIEEETGFYTSSGPSGESLYVGRSWSSIKDDETGKQFKEDVEKKLEKLLGEKIVCGTYEEGWRDG